MSKAYPQIQVKQYPDDQPGFQKPFLGYHRNKGMPSAREPMEQLDLSGPKAMKGLDSEIHNAKNVKFCKKKCEFRSKKRSSGCSWHIDISKCDPKKLNKIKVEKPDYKPPLKGKGIYDEK